MNKVLVADIDRTYVRYGVASNPSGSITVSDCRKISSEEFYSFDLSLEKYLSSIDLTVKEVHAVFGVAGAPVINTVQVPNSDWFLDGSALASKYGFKSVTLVNDFHSIARSIPELDQCSFELIRKGTSDPDSPIVVAGADIGLGVSTLLPSNNKKVFSVVSGEGGHSTYTPLTKTEKEVVVWLSKHFNHISAELISSGIGYQALYTSLCHVYDREVSQVTERESFERANAGDDMFQELHSIRARCLMGLAGDLVLINGARGGVVLAGSRSKCLFSYLKSPEALARFVNKGLKKNYLENCPIRLLHKEEASLHGAAAVHFQTLVH